MIIEGVRRLYGNHCSKSYPLKIPVYHCLTMYIYQTPGDVFELSEGIVSDGRGHRYEWGPTSSNRFASLCALTNSLMFPFTIHSDTIAKWRPPITTPKSGSTLGWRRVVHVTTSLQNLCMGQPLISQYNFLARSWEPTLVILPKSLVE